MPFSKEKQKEYMKKYREENKEKRKQYLEKNKEQIREYQKNRRNDPWIKLTTNIRNRTTKAVLRSNISKNNSTMKMLGCDKNTLMDHLQKTGELYDPNFNIYDYDTSLYHVDHIKTFEDVSKGIYTLEEVCHYTNLQILPADINRLKSGTSW